MLNKWKILTKFTNHKIQKKKKKRKEKTLIIFVSGIPGTNISLDQRSKYTGTKLQMLWVCF
jgi:predicted HTH domain antitoxin